MQQTNMHERNTDLIPDVNVDPERKPGARDHQNRRQKHLQNILSVQTRNVILRYV